MHRRQLPDLSPAQVIETQDALLSNADRLLAAALADLRLDNVGLARSLAILGMEESGKAIAIHERRVEMAYAPEGEPFVNDRLSDLWTHHQSKPRLVHQFLVEERYWFGTEPADPEANHAYLGTIKRWTSRHDNLKLRGFYVDVDKVGNALTPTAVADEESLREVISHVHQIGWQLRLGEHIEAKGHAEAEQGLPPASEEDVQHMRAALAHVEDDDLVEHILAGMRDGKEGARLNNDAYRLRLSHEPSANVGRPGYEAETRELQRLSDELDKRQATDRE